jgi:hypothetical protein
MQNVVDGQLTPQRKLSWLLDVSGELTMLQALPFHFSVRVCSRKEEVTVSPAAKHDVVLTQLTELRSLETLLAFGDAAIDHAVPFHVRINV